MQNDGKVNILMVDDRPDKLLALDAVLSELGENIVKANSGRDALRAVLNQEFAVILLDVNMPGMDGFETASLIRQRRNCENTPIIFITAFADEMQLSRGYSLGAVDYILAPVVPQVLRTKVAVFVDLYRKREQVRRQADWLRNRAAQLYRLTGASIKINSALSLDKTVELITESAREVIGAHMAGTVLVLEGGWSRAIQHCSFSDKYGHLRSVRESADEQGIFSLVCRSNRSARLSQQELQNNAFFQVAQTNGKKMLPQRGWLAAPLVSRDGKNIGLLHLSDKVEGDFTEDDEAVLVQLAQMGSIAIENTIFAEAREANRVKDEFLATLSHELRTPLNAMLGWTRLLRMGKLNGNDSAHGLEVIERNVNAQARLIEDLLDVSRIMTGKFKLNVRPMSLISVVEAAIDAVRPASDAKEIKIIPQLDPTADQITGDADRMQQVVWNLLTNGIKFTGRGGRLEVALTRDSGYIHLAIKDNGAGIDTEFLPYVFDRFRQADSSSTRHHGGLGIGLAIVRHVVELHGGMVKADSMGLGHGATFTISLPVAALHVAADEPRNARGRGQRGVVSSATPAPCEDLLEGLHVLVVDDEPDAREIIGEVLRRHHASVSIAGSAQEAMEAFEARIPDIILSDIAMPQEDGYSLMRRIRAKTAEAGGQVPAIALTAYARDEDRMRALAAGYQLHLAKPVEPADLACVVASVAGRSLKAQNGETPSEPSAALKYG